MIFYKIMAKITDLNVREQSAVRNGFHTATYLCNNLKIFKLCLPHYSKKTLTKKNSSIM